MPWTSAGRTNCRGQLSCRQTGRRPAAPRHDALPRRVLPALATTHERSRMRVGRVDPMAWPVDVDRLSHLDHHEVFGDLHGSRRSEEHTYELQSLMRISYAVLCLKKKTKTQTR